MRVRICRAISRLTSDLVFLLVFIVLLSVLFIALNSVESVVFCSYNNKKILGLMEFYALLKVHLEMKCWLNLNECVYSLQ